MMKTIRTTTILQPLIISCSIKGMQLRLLIILLFISSFTVAFAQTRELTGKLTDEKNNPLDFANVAVLKAADSSFVAGTMTDGEGRFSILTPVNGSYIMRFSFIGFIEIYSEPFTVIANDFSKNFGTIVLKQDPKTLKDVTIKTQRPSIIQMSDRLVVNVQGTALAAGSTAFDVLARSPGVFVDHEGNIQLNGRAGVTVMIDGKRTYLSARELRTMLEGMSSENIKNIELITNPSAKYDAEGSSGILNINLKKNTQQGINGSVYGGYTYNGYDHGYSTGGNINHKSGKWNSFMSIDMARRVGGREATFTRIFYAPQLITYFDQVATGNFYGQGPSVRFGTDYSINTKHSVGFVFNYMNNKSEQDFLTETYIGNAPNEPSQFIDADNISSNRFKNLTSNIHYVNKLDTLGSTISADFDYVRIRVNSVADFYNYYTQLSTGVVTEDFLHTEIPSGFDIYSAKIDYSKILSKNRKIEGGAKTSSVTSDNDSRFYFNNNGLVLDPARTNHFNYEEKIYAAYINYSGNLGRKATLQLGLRAENTKSVGNSITTHQVTTRNYTSLFPSIFITQKINENYGITWSYSRRLQRPNYGNLNPFRFYRDPYTYIEGNPYLRPQYAHAFSVTQTFKKMYTLIASFQLNKDFMAELPKLDIPNATTIYYTGNVDGNYNAGVTFIAPFRIAKFWDTQNTTVVSFNHYSIEVDKKDIVNEQLYYMLQSNHTIHLPKEFRMELNLLYQGPAAFGLYQIAPRGRVDLGFKKSILKKKLDISANLVDIFKTQRLKFKTDINGNVNDFDQYLRPRFMGLTLRYNFSKGQKVDVKRRSTVEELNRT